MIEFMNAATLNQRGEDYFHSSAALVRPGAVFEPGRFGRAVRMYSRQQGNADLLFREYVLETVRAARFRDRPSRMHCIFLFETALDAIRFQQDHGRQAEYLYRVRLLDPRARLFRADLNKVAPATNVPFLEAMQDLAEVYWRGEELDHVEVLSYSAVEVVSRFHHLTDPDPEKLLDRALKLAGSAPTPPAR
jgi:hypothetical protein